MTTDLAVIGSAIILLTAVWAVTAHLINREPATPGSHARRHRSLRAAWWRLYDSSHITAARFARRYTRDQRREHEIGGDTGATGALPAAVAESAPLDPLPADTTVYEVGELPRPVTTLNLPAQVSSRPTVSDPEGAMGVNAPHLGGESDSPGSHELPAPRAGGLDLPCGQIAVTTPSRAPQGSTEPSPCKSGHGSYTRYADDSGLMPAVTENIKDALGVTSRTRWLDEAFDRVLLDLRAEMAILDHRFAYAGAA